MATPRRPPGRYDEPRGPLPRPVLVAGGALFGLLLIALAVFNFRFSSGTGPTAGVLSYNVLGDHAVEVTFQVRKDPAAIVACRVRARNREGAEVGAEDVLIGPSDRGTVVVVHLLKTSDRPASGEVGGCGVPSSPAPSSPVPSSPVP